MGVDFNLKIHSTKPAYSAILALHITFMTQKSFIFIGRSGCGKGTQAKMLMEYLKTQSERREVIYIQTGAELRDFIKGDNLSHTQKMVKDIYDVGGLQREFVVVYMWAKVLVDKFTGKEHIIFDGCPRKFHEAGVMDSVFEFYKLQKPYVIHLDIDKETSIDRLLSRGRMDDDRKVIEERLSWYEKDVVPAIKYYEDGGAHKFIRIDGKLPREEIFAEIAKEITSAIN